MKVMSIRRRQALRDSWLWRYATPPTRLSVGWEHRAACKDMAAEMFPATNSGVIKASATCQTCPVRLECLHDAFDAEATGNTNHIFGIRGGLSATARREFLEAHPEVRPHRKEAIA